MTTGNCRTGSSKLAGKHRRAFRKMQGRALWWVLAVVLLAIYFIVFRPREPADAPDLPTPAEQQEQTAPDAAERLPTPEGEGLGAQQDPQLRRDLDFIARAFPVLSSWDVAAVKPLLSPATLAGDGIDAQLAEVMGVLGARLGALQTFEQPVPTLEADAQQAADRTGRLQHYEFVASYENGVADVDLVVHQLPESSSLYSFNINVPTN